MTSQPAFSGDLSKDLSTLLARGVSPEEFARRLFYINLEQTRTTDPELAEMLRACAIPHRFDAGIIGILREAPDDREMNERLLAGLIPFSFVLARREGGYVYHDNIRDMLLEDWRTQENRNQFDQLNQRLVTFYEAEHEKSREIEQDLGRVAHVVQRASSARYVQLVSIIETRVVVPLLEALYHETLRSAQAGYELFSRYCHAYEEIGRLTVCESLLNATRSYLEHLPANSGQEPWLKWLKYWQGRLSRQLFRYAEAETILRDLLPQTEDDIKLKLWALGELGTALDQQYKLLDARQVFEEELALAEKTREDIYNLPVSYSRVASLHWTLGELGQAVEKQRKSIQSAQEQRNLRMEIYSSLDLSGVLHDLGEWTEALSIALQAFHLVRTQLPQDQAINQAINSRFMSLLIPRDPALLDTLFVESKAQLTTMGNTLGVFQLCNQYIDLLQKSGQLVRASASVTDLKQGASSYTNTTIDTELLLTEASLYEDQGRVDEAITLYTQIIERAKGGKGNTWNHAAALSNRGMKNVERAHWQEAEVDLQEAIAKWQEIGHKNLEAFIRVYWADSLRRQGQMTEAQRLLDEARIPLESTNSGHLADYHKVQGDVYWDQAQFGKAHDRYLQAITINRLLNKFEQTARNLGNLATIAADQGKWGEAVQHTAEANALWLRLAQTSHYQPSEAAEQADDKNARGLRYFCAAGGDRRENLARARDFFRSASEQFPGNFWYNLNLAYAHAELEEWAEAAGAVETVLERGPEWLRSSKLNERLAEYHLKHCEVLQAEGERRLKEGLPNKAVEQFTQALEIVRESLADNKKLQAELHGRLALGNFLIEKSDAAQKHYQEAINLHRSQGKPSPGITLAETFNSLIPDSHQSWILWDGLRSLDASADADQDLRTALAETRQAIISSLDRLYGLDQSKNESDIPIVTPIVLEVGDEIVPKVDPKDPNSDGGKFIEKDIPAMREQRIEKDTGVWIPGVRVRGMGTAGDQFVIQLDENPVIRGSVKVGKGYCPALPGELHQLGIPLEEIANAPNPWTGEEGSWVSFEYQDKIQQAGLELWTETMYMIYQLEVVLRCNLANFVGISEVETILENHAKTAADKQQIASTLPDHQSRVRFARLLRTLVKESIPITNIEEILQAIQERQLLSGNPDEAVRQIRLRRRSMLPGNRPEVQCIQFPLNWEERVNDWLGMANGKTKFAPPPDLAHQLIQEIAYLVSWPNRNSVLVVRHNQVRPFLRRMIENRFPDLMVMSEEELVTVAEN